MVLDRTPRRYVLRSTGIVGTSALAGCLGDDSSGSENSGEDGDGACSPGHTEGDPPCQQVADDASNLVRFDPSGTDLLVSFEYPCGWQPSTTDQFDDRFQANVGRSDIGSGESQTTVDIQVRTSTSPVEDDYVQSQMEGGSYEKIEYEYDGSTRTAAVSAQSGDFDEQYGANGYAAVPFEGSLYSVELVPTVKGSPCGAEADELVIDMIQSLEPNPDTTFSPA